MISLVSACRETRLPVRATIQANGTLRPLTFGAAGWDSEDTAAAQTAADSLTPPISPRRAFLYSFLFPGAGQAALGRSGAGGTFFLVEVAALALVHRSAEDLRIARAFSRDSIPLSYQYDPTSGRVARSITGEPVVAEWSKARYDSTWVKTRRLHYEDWLAVLFFNHLFAGADAFVAAQLWDLPGKVAIRRTPYGSVISLAFPFR